MVVGKRGKRVKRGGGEIERGLAFDRHFGGGFRGFRGIVKKVKKGA